MTIVMAAAPAWSSADQNSKGGVITGYTANGATGTITVTIKNPYNTPAGASVGVFTDSSAPTSQSTGDATATLGPGQTITVTFNLAPFKSSWGYGDVNDGAGHDMNGSGASTGGKCTTCDDGPPDNDPTE